MQAVRDTPGRTPLDESPRPFDTKGPRRRQLILKQSAELFSKKGFHAVGVDDIGGAVGITGPGIYRHFRNKNAILIAIFDLATEWLLQGAERIHRDTPSPREALQELVEFHLEFALQEGAVISVYGRDGVSLPAVDRSRIRRRMALYVEDWVHVLSELRSDLLDSEIRAMVHGILGLINTVPTLDTGLPLQRTAALARSMALATGLTGGHPIKPSTYRPPSSPPVDSARDGTGLGVSRPTTAGERQYDGRGAPVQARAKRRRELILEAAAASFRERGFHAVGVDEIAEKASITGPGIYYHFPNKEALLVELLDQAYQRTFAPISDFAAGPLPVDERLMEMIRSYIAFVLEDRALIAVYLHEERNLPEEAQSRFRRAQRMYLTTWSQVVMELRPELNDSETRAIAQLVLGEASAAAFIDTSLEDEQLASLYESMATEAVNGASSAPDTN